MAISGMGKIMEQNEIEQIKEGCRLYNTTVESLSVRKRNQLKLEKNNFVFIQLPFTEYIYYVEGIDMNTK